MTGRAPSILFVHDQHPGQFGALARYLAEQGWAVQFATHQQARPSDAPYPTLGYAPHRAPAPQTHPYAQAYDRAALLGQACARACLKAQKAGRLAPDIVVSHAGPGAGLFLRDVFPGAHIVAYCEWWHAAPGVDTAYLAALQGRVPDRSAEARILARSRNVAIAGELLSADRGWSPTQFQADQFPPDLRRKITVRHDGVDAGFHTPLPVGAELAPPEDPALATLPTDARVITYATRGMERHRGFPQVCQAFAQVAAAHPDARFVIAGENRVFYGADGDREIDWLARMRAMYPAMAERLICPGTLGRSDYLWLLRRSAAHVYCTVPFVLSWSLLEAMAAGAPLVVSDVAPVREVVRPDCALFADLGQTGALAAAIRAVLNDPQAAARRAAMARKSVKRCYDSARLLPAHAAWLRAGRQAKTGARQPVPFEQIPAAI